MVQNKGDDIVCVGNVIASKQERENNSVSTAEGLAYMK